MKKLLISCALLLPILCSAQPVYPRLYHGTTVYHHSDSDYSFEPLFTLKPAKSDTMKDVIKSTGRFGKWVFLESAARTTFLFGLLGAVTSGLGSGVGVGLGAGVGLGLGLSAGVGVLGSGIALTGLSVQCHNKYVNKNLPQFKKKMQYHNFLRLGDNELNIV